MKMPNVLKLSPINERQQYDMQNSTNSPNINGKKDNNGCENNDPHAQMSLKPTSYLDTLAHMVKSTVGGGMLAMGTCYKNGGLILAPILTIVIGVITTYNQYILVCMADDFQIELKRTHLSFSETIEIGFQKGPKLFQKISKVMAWSTQTFIFLAQIGFCCGYFVVVSKSANQILNHYGIEVTELECLNWSFPIFLLTVMIRELKYIAPISTIANICVLASIITIIYINTRELPSIYDRNWVGDWKSLPLCFGTIVYALEGINLVLPLQQNMSKRHQFLGTFGVLNMSIFIVELVSISFGFFGYYKYGENVQGSLIQNLDPDHYITQVVITGMTLGILFTYAIQFFVPVFLLLPEIKKRTNAWPGSEWHLYEYLLRTILVLVTYLVARMVPKFDLLVSLIGAVSASLLALVYAPLANLFMRDNKQKTVIQSFLNIISILVGILGFVFGTYYSVEAIIIALKEEQQVSSSFHGL